MDLKKAKAFNARMGKAKHFPRHQNLSKGGMVDRKKFADGGATTQSTDGSQGLGFGSGSVFNPGQALYDPKGFTNAIGGVSNGIASAFTPQSGYQAQLAPVTNLNYAPTVAAGTNTALNAAPVNSAITAEQELAGKYGDIAAGRGPNPAMAQLAQTTGTNVANTAALQAGQRGSAQNVGLAARQIGQQAATTQQQAVGQGATLAAQQELAAMGAQGGLQNQIANQGLGEQGIGANVLATGAGALNAQNANEISNYAQAQGLNQQTAQNNAAATQKTVGGLLGGVGSVLSFLAKGGQVHPGPHKSHVGNYLFAEGGSTEGVKALVSPREVYLNPHQVREVVERGADPMKIGHHFPGQDKVKKNSQKNDVIPVTLEDGGVVLPISVTTHKDASQKGRKFVEKAHAKRYMRKPKGI